jgi:hypothetical protein
MLAAAISCATSLVSIDARGMGAPEYCDPRLPLNSSRPTGYQPRGDRCEGQYAQAISASTLFVVAFQSSSIAMQPMDKVVVSWAKSDSTVHLRVKSSHPEAFYQMDTQRAAGDEHFAWSMEIIKALGVNPGDLLALVSSTISIGEAEHLVYRPLTFGPKHAVGAYALFVTPGIDFDEVFYSVKRVAREHPMNASVVTPRTPLNRGFYPKTYPIKIPLPELVDPGLYYIELTGERPNAEEIARPVWCEIP